MKQRAFFYETQTPPASDGSGYRCDGSMFLTASFAAELLAARLRACKYDLSLLSQDGLAEVESLARAARIELPRRGREIGSTHDAHLFGNEATRAEPRP